MFILNSDEQYDLDIDEIVSYRLQNIQFSEDTKKYGKADVTITNKNVIVVTKSFFGKTKETFVCPIQDVKIYRNEAQATIYKKEDQYHVDVYFLDFEAYFKSDKKKEMIELVDSISMACVAKPANITTISRNLFPGADLLQGVMKESVNIFVDNKNNQSEENQPKMIKGKCRGCHAPISAYPGKEVKCPYCDTVQKVEQK